MPLRVGVDAANLIRDRRGIGRYVTNLILSWRAQFAQRIEPVLVVPQRFPALLRRAFADRLGVDVGPPARRADLARRGIQVMWYPWNGMTWRSAVPSVVTVHDLWPFVTPASDPAKRRREQSHYLAAARWANRFIAVSRFSAGQATEYLGVPPERIDVIPHGVGPIARNGVAPATFSGLRAYVLFVGEAEPRKDLPTLIAAMDALPEELRRTTGLVIAGKAQPVSAGASATGLRIEWAGEVPDDRLAALYAGAAAFVLPSRYEGFGLPVLEAMSYGTPVIAAAAGALPEAGDVAAVYFPPGDAGALAAALARVVGDRSVAQRLSDAGRARAALMTVARCAERTIEVFEHVAAG